MIRMDFLTPTARSERMSLIRKTDTTPELIVRRMVHRLGFRFRLHCRDLPGTPDLVFRRAKKVIEVRGCFWHSHKCRKNKRPVASRCNYWHPKLVRNVNRDRQNLRRLRNLGWQVLVVWECETKNTAALATRIGSFLAAETVNATKRPR